MLITLLGPGILAIPAVTTVAAPTVNSAWQDDEAAVEAPAWHGAVSAGFTTTTGNTDRTSFALNADATREGEWDRWTLSFLMATADENGNTTESRIFTSAQYDYFIEEDWYVFGRTSFQRDRVADLDSRLRIGAGAGRQLWDEESRQLAIEAGLTYTIERFDESTDSDDEFLAAALAARLMEVLREGVVLHSDLELYPALDNIDNFTAFWDTRLRVDLNGSLYLEAQAVFNYDNSPALGADELDGRYVLTVGWAF